MDTFGAIVAGLVPSVGVGLLFWLAMRKIVRADRNEREALERLEAERDGASQSAQN
jgi:predicted permease